MFFSFVDNRCRSSTIDLQNPQCPICQVSLNGQDMITHVQHELDTIERRQRCKKKRENKVKIIRNIFLKLFIIISSRFFKIIIIISIKHLKHDMKYEFQI